MALVVADAVDVVLRDEIHEARHVHCVEIVAVVVVPLDDDDVAIATCHVVEVKMTMKLLLDVHYYRHVHVSCKANDVQMHDRPVGLVDKELM